MGEQKAKQHSLNEENSHFLSLLTLLAWVQRKAEATVFDLVGFFSSAKKDGSLAHSGGRSNTRPGGFVAGVHVLEKGVLALLCV